MTQNNWEDVKNYFNGFRKGKHIMRKDFIDTFKERTCILTTIETYRMYLTNAGYLEHVGRGLYKKVRKIPKGLTIRMAQASYIFFLNKICKEW